MQAVLYAVLAAAGPLSRQDLSDAATAEQLLALIRTATTAGHAAAEGGLSLLLRAFSSVVQALMQLLTAEQADTSAEVSQANRSSV